MGSQELSVNWNAHSSALVSEFQKLLLNKSLVDCTIAAEGQYLRVHKVVLSACSPYFQILLNEESDKHPIIILRDVKFEDLKRIIEFVYQGEVKLPEEKLFEFLSVAESLQIKGLGDKSNEAFGKRHIVDLLSKKRPETLSSSSEHMLNQSISSGNIIEKSITCAKLSSSQNSNSQTQCQQPFTNSVNIPSSSRSSSSSSNDISAIVRNNSRGSDLSCSEAKPSQDNVEHLPPFNTASVKEEIIIDDDDDDDDDEDMVTKEEYSYEEIGTEFPEESYDIDTRNQDVKPSTSQQYTELPSTHMPSDISIPENVSTGTQGEELNRVEGISACFDGGILSDCVPCTYPEDDLNCSTYRSTALTSAVNFCGLRSNVTEARTLRLLSRRDQPCEGEVIRYACDLCHYSLITQTNIHSVGKEFQCELCSNALRRVAHSGRKALVYDESKPYKCDVCSRKLQDRDALEHHIVWHKVEKFHKCKACSKTFISRSLLERHMLTHTGEKPFKCVVCQKVFRQKSHLKAHSRAHDGDRP